LQNNIKYTTQKRAYLELAVIKMINHQSVDQAHLETKIDEMDATIKLLQEQIKQGVVTTKVVETKEAPSILVNQTPLVTVSEIEEILNQGDRNKRTLLKKGWPLLKDYEVA